MQAIKGDLWTQGSGSAVSRRAALRGLGGVGVATALAVSMPSRAGASNGHGIECPLSASLASDDPEGLIDDYVAAVNAGDLEAILALYDDAAFHIALPSPDGSAGVCVGKDQFRMWYEQSVANGDRIEIENGTLAIDGNQLAYVARLTSEPWAKLGVDSLEAHSEMVLSDGRIMTHVVVLTPESVRQLAAAHETAAT